MFQISSPSYGVDEFLLVAGTMKTLGVGSNREAQSQGNAEWLPIDCDITTRVIPMDDRKNAALDATVRWKRNYIYYVMVLFVPTFVISLISIFGVFTADGTVAEKVHHVAFIFRSALDWPIS